jgi:hypothetical protein
MDNNIYLSAVPLRKTICFMPITISVIKIYTQFCHITITSASNSIKIKSICKKKISCNENMWVACLTSLTRGAVSIEFNTFFVTTY